MQEALYHQTSRIEEHHWWFRHRRLLIDQLLRNLRWDWTDVRALDVGCGSGGDLGWLSEHCRSAVGLDRSELALRLARSKRPQAVVLQADANQLDQFFAPGSFDLITVFNVLYHGWVPDEVELLRQVRRTLRPGGLLVLNEPALPVLSRRHDAQGFGVRRFLRRELIEKLTAAGLAPVRVAYANSMSLPPAMVLAGLDRLRDRLAGPQQESSDLSELNLPADPINRLLVRICGLERWWIRSGFPTPWGVSLLALARRADR